MGGVRGGFGQRRLARLDIPVAILAPEKPIERLCDFIEFVSGEGGVDFTNRLVELEQNPFVVRSEQSRIDLALHFECDSDILPEVWTLRGRTTCRRDAGSTLTLHLPEAAGVPEFVAEVAAQLDVFLVEKHILAERRAAHRAEANGVGAVFRDQFERVGRIAELLRHLAALLVADEAGEINVAE